VTEIRPQHSLLQLGGRLQDPADRERYAQLAVWLHSMPKEDDMVRLAELLGFLTLIGSALPGAFSSAVDTLTGLAEKNATYHESLNERLKSIPDDVWDAIDINDLAAQLGESFRQQIASTSLANTNEFLLNTTRNLRLTTDALTAAMNPITQKYNSIGDVITKEVERLGAAAQLLRGASEQLTRAATMERGAWQFLLAAGLIGIGWMLRLVWDSWIKHRI
jgi:hypothetical protein